MRKESSLCYKLTALFLVLALVVPVLVGCGGGKEEEEIATPSPPATPTPMATSTPTAIPTPTLAPTQISTSTPTSTPTRTGPPTYSQVLKTYPRDVSLCRTDAFVEAEYGEDWLISGTVEIANGQEQIQWYGTKITLKIPITLEGRNYPPGTKLTVDKDLHWIEVSSWD